MTPEESIKMLRGMQNKKVDYAELVCAPAFAYGYEYVYPEPEDYAIEEAITALKEIQQYREMDKKLREAYGDCDGLLAIAVEGLCKHPGINIGEPIKARLLIDEDVDKWDAYREIGTVEECREAVEKQKPQKPKDSLKIDPVIDENGAYVDADTTVYLLCPNCGEMVGIEDNCDRFCHECGQAIDNENLEGMEDENT